MREPDRTAGKAVEPREEAELHEHPGPLQYIVIGVILTVITAVEIAVYYIDVLAQYDVQILIPLSTAKFILVVLFYMHLKFDSRVFTGVFVAPMLLAVAVVVSLYILFRMLPFFPAA